MYNQPNADGVLRDVLAGLFADGVSGVGAVITVPSYGTDELSIDFGFLPRVLIGNYVFLDVGRDGIQSPGDAAIAGVVVELLSADESVLLATTSAIACVYRCCCMSFKTSTE